MEVIEYQDEGMSLTQPSTAMRRDLVCSSAEVMMYDRLSRTLGTLRLIGRMFGLSHTGSY